MDFHCSFRLVSEWLRVIRMWLCTMDAVSKADRQLTPMQSHFMLKCEASQNLQPASALQGRPLDLQTHPLGLDDLYELAESTRLHSSLLSRRCAVQQAQKLLQVERRTSGASDVNGCRSQTSSVDHVRWHSATRCSAVVLSDFGRPPAPSSRLAAVTSQDLEGLVPEDNVDLSPGYVRRVEISVKDPPGAAEFGCDHRGHSTFFPFKPKSADQETKSNGSPTSVALECYDVIGPSACRGRREMGRTEPDQQQTKFAELNAFERSVALCTLVQRLYPDMTQAEIQRKLWRRQITTRSLFSPSLRPVRSRGDQDPTCCRVHDFNDTSTQDGSRNRDSDVRSSAEGSESDSTFACDGFWTNDEVTENSKMATAQPRGQPSTPLFFSSLKHMNSKIYRGQAARSLGTHKREERSRSGISAANAFFSSFVSPRKTKATQERRCQSVFGPPLLAKSRQIANPSFFAGSDIPYSLPERLPDLLVFTNGTSTASPHDPTPTFFRSASVSLTSGGHKESPVST